MLINPSFRPLSRTMKTPPPFPSLVSILWATAALLIYFSFDVTVTNATNANEWDYQESHDIIFPSQLPLPTDPQPAQSLTHVESSAILDLFNALIKGSPAQAAHHSDWYTNGVTSNPCSFKTAMAYHLIQIQNPLIETISHWCKVGNDGIKYLDAIDIDLIPTTSIKLIWPDPITSLFLKNRYVLKDPGQISYLIDDLWCHSKNWYAMIAKQKSFAYSTYASVWSKSGDQSGVRTYSGPQTACKMTYSTTGILPPSLSKLTKLTSLRIRLSGLPKQPIPAWIGSSYTHTHTHTHTTWMDT